MRRADDPKTRSEARQSPREDEAMAASHCAARSGARANVFEYDAERREVTRYIRPNLRVHGFEAVPQIQRPQRAAIFKALGDEQAIRERRIDPQWVIDELTRAARAALLQVGAGLWRGRTTDELSSQERGELREWLNPLADFLSRHRGLNDAAMNYLNGVYLDATPDDHPFSMRIDALVRALRRDLDPPAKPGAKKDTALLGFAVACLRVYEFATGGKAKPDDRRDDKAEDRPARFAAFLEAAIRPTALLSPKVSVYWLSRRACEHARNSR